MPYRANSALPDSVKSALPGEAQSVWRRVFNSAMSRGASEESAFKQAWGALKNQGWRKGGNGKWMKKNFRFAKLDEEKQYVFGWANISVLKDGNQVVDLQNDRIDPEVLADAGYRFVLESRQTGVMHKGEAVGELIEHVSFTKEKLEAMGLEPGSVPLGTWCGFHVRDPEIFSKVKSGELTMFSIQGNCRRVPDA